MTIKRTPKRPMIWTGDLPVRHFSARPVDLSIEFQMDAVQMLEDLEELWKKFEMAFWKKFVPMMNKEIGAVETQVKQWDPKYPKWKPEEQKAAVAKLDGMTKSMGERVKKESAKFSQEAFTETMKGVDNKVAKAKVTAVVKFAWTIAGAAASVASAVGIIKIPMEVLKAKKELQTAQEEFSKDWDNLQSKAETVQTSALAVGQAFNGLRAAGENEKLVKAAMQKIRDAGKKLQEDVTTMDVYIASARQSLIEQEKKASALEKSLTDGKVKATEAMQTIRQWKEARSRCAAVLDIAATSKVWAAKAQAELAGATLGNPGTFVAATRKVNEGADKVLKVNDVVEKGKTILEVIEKLVK